jgi:hypothetical protein
MACFSCETDHGDAQTPQKRSMIGLYTAAVDFPDPGFVGPQRLPGAQYGRACRLGPAARRAAGRPSDPSCPSVIRRPPLLSRSQDTWDRGLQRRERLDTAPAGFFSANPDSAQAPTLGSHNRARRTRGVRDRLPRVRYARIDRRLPSRPSVAPARDYSSQSTSGREIPHARQSTCRPTDRGAHLRHSRLRSGRRICRVRPLFHDIRRPGWLGFSSNSPGAGRYPLADPRSWSWAGRRLTKMSSTARLAERWLAGRRQARHRSTERGWFESGCRRRTP